MQLYIIIAASFGLVCIVRHFISLIKVLVVAGLLVNWDFDFYLEFGCLGVLSRLTSVGSPFLQRLVRFNVFVSPIEPLLAIEHMYRCIVSHLSKFEPKLVVPVFFFGYRLGRYANNHVFYR
jgi:hypothetical protein